MPITSNAVSLSLSKIVEGIAIAFGAMLKSSLPEFCSLETADSENTLVTSEGRLLSGFKVEGLVSAIGTEEFENIVGKLVGALRPFLKDTGHTIQVFASRDPDAVGATLRDASRGTRATLKKLNLNLEDVMDSRETNLARFCSAEAQYIAVWTHPGAISTGDLKTASKKRREAALQVPPGARKGGGQDLFSTLFELREEHESFVRSVEVSLGTDKAGFAVKLLTAHEMIHVARHAQDPGFTPPKWKPTLPGDKLPGIFRGQDAPRDLTLADVQYPPLSWQLFPRDAVKVANKYVAIGDRLFAPVFIEIPPQDIEPFSNLFDKLNTIGVPWNVSFTIDGGGMKYATLRAGMASFLTWASPYNGKIKQSVAAMQEHARDSGATYVRLKIALCTWAPVDDVALLRARVSKLVHAVTSWGDCEVREVVGSPVAGLFSTIPFLSHESIANPSVAPLNHVMRMIPIMRQASPWSEGSVLYRTRDGKLIPFEPGSEKQDTWNYILFAPPGSGKSVQMANLLLAVITQPGLKQLPRIGIVDIGPSSRGLMRLLQDALPASERHKVAYIRLRNTPEYAINPFDTFPGCRFPTPEHKAFLVNLLSQIATPAERDAAYSSISEIASQVIDDIYRLKSDSSRSSPNLYERGLEPAIDALLDKLNYAPNRTSSWWTVVDFLFSNGHSHESGLAQRHAVPNMGDIPGAAQSQTIKDQYGAPKVETDETLNAVFSRLVTSGIRMYPILSSKTKFDLGEIRIAALDIDEVAKSGSVADDRQTALMYMTARFILTRDYKLDKKFAESDQVPEMYRAHLLKKATDNKENMKWICYDEFHRTSNSPAVQSEVLVDMREGRKWNLGVILASQSLDDFPDVIKEFATGVFILKAANNKVANNLQRLFGLNDTTKALILRYCNGPDPRTGAPMLVHLMLKSGVTDMLLYSTLGPYEMWALSTTAEDAALVERVTDALQNSNPDDASRVARAALARMFPGGVKSKVAELKRSMSLDPTSQEADAGAIQILAEQVLASIAAQSRGRKGS